MSKYGLCSSYPSHRSLLVLLIVVSCRSGRAIPERLARKPAAKLTQSFSRATTTPSHDVIFGIRGGESILDPYPGVDMDAFLGVIDVCGTALFAFSGTLTAGRKGMDIMGMTIIALITAMGGGTIRDLLFNKGTVFWMQDVVYLKICVVTTLLTFLLWPTLEYKLGWKDSAVPVCTADALGLAAFAILGTQKAIKMELHPMIWIVSGLMTSCFGGIVRDILCLQRPRIMYPERSLYATPPLMGTVVYTLLTLRCPQIDKQLIASISFVTTFSARVFSFNSQTRLPYWRPLDVIIPEDDCDI
jgi:uncharacterized membrane protein YeiH